MKLLNLPDMPRSWPTWSNIHKHSYWLGETKTIDSTHLSVRKHLGLEHTTCGHSEAMTIGCFVCSELDSIDCPDSNSDYSSWKSISDHFTELDDSLSNDGLSCSLVVGSKWI